MKRVVLRLRRVFRRSLYAGVTLLAAAAAAQAPAAEACTTVVRAALQAADAACSGTGRNQVCYGNVLGEAVPADGITDLQFEEIGDVAPVAQIKTLSLSPLDETANQWGVALMQLQANLPDTLPGQNVTFLLFGDVEIEDAVDEQVRVPALSLRAANVRQRPTTNAEVLGALPRGTTVEATGKYVNSQGEVWLRVRYDGHRTRTGWAFGNLFQIEFASLPDVPADSLVLNPMQAFYFRTGIGRATCAEAPTSGVVVQTPEGAGLVNFTVNGVDVTLGSTAVITGTDAQMSIALLEGTGTVSHSGVSRQLVPGSESTLFMAVGEAEPAPPSIPKPIERERFAIVEEVMTLAPRDVKMPEPATQTEINGANTPPGSGPGIIRLEIRVPACPPGSTPEACACNDVDSDGRCDAVPCSAKYPTMCVPDCRDADGDGKCDVQCFDQDGDGRCDDAGGNCNASAGSAGCPPPCTQNGGGTCCADDNHDGACDEQAPPVACFAPGPVICDPGCVNNDGDEMCDEYDNCIDVDRDGVCDPNACGGESAETSTCDPAPTPTPELGKNEPVPTPTPRTNK